MDEGPLEEGPARLFDRLRQIKGYTWDESKPAYHSSYDNWLVFGTRDAHSTRKLKKNISEGVAYQKHNHQIQRSISDSGSSTSTSSSSSSVGDGGGGSDCHDETKDNLSFKVIACVSTHILPEERSFHLCKNLIRNFDPDGNHFPRPIKILRLLSQPGDKGPFVVCIYEYLGPNFLPRIIDYGPAFYKGRQVGDTQKTFRDNAPLEPIQLQMFMDFAVGATECLEILHHGQKITHGEIRGDAFHMNSETGKVRLVNFGSGLRTFEYGLTSNGWSSLSKQIGAKTKLCFMSPEQTGRMPTEPDRRTDIYSLGILFWTMLVQQPAFDGETPMDIIQGVLGQRLPSVSNIRLDVPNVIGRIIQKMTAKVIGERYHSASALRYDLVEVRSLLGTGDSVALKNWKIGTKDVSSFFILPTIMIGRSEERDEIVKIIDKVSRRHTATSLYDSYSASSFGTSLTEGKLENFETASGIADQMSSDGDAASSLDGRSGSFTNNLMSGDLRPPRSSSSHMRSITNSSQHTSHDSLDGSTRLIPIIKPGERSSVLTLDSARSITESINSDQQSKNSLEGYGTHGVHRNTQKFRRKGRCEVICIAGTAGLGKTFLVQSIQIEARRRGYFASSKFEQAKRATLRPVLKLLSSLFRQVFSESDTNTAFHQMLKKYVSPVWPMLHKVLDLPIFLLGTITTCRTIYPVPLTQQNYNKNFKADFEKESSPTNSFYSMALPAQSAQDFLRAGSSTKSVRLLDTFLDVLQVFTQHKFICLCLDDLQYADEESLDLITQILASRMKIVIIVTYRPDEPFSEKVRGIVEPSNTKDHIKSGGVGITKVTLKPLSDNDTKKYIAATLCRSEADVASLAAVINSKTAGNPFYLREMLDICHRKQIIYFDYKQSVWRYDIDKISQEFKSSEYQDKLNNDIVVRRLNELPSASKAILAWASFIGNSFLFSMIRKLLSGEFDYNESTHFVEDSQKYSLSYSKKEAVEGLQAAIQACIIVATEDDERFMFAHDRYAHAAGSLRIYSSQKMHFIIAQTLLKYYLSEDQDNIAMHIGKSIETIKSRVVHRFPFRKVLYDCAQSAAERGARNSALRYYIKCFALLQDNPWKVGAIDVYYDESLQLHTRAAECYLYTESYSEATKLLEAVFSCAQTEVEKAPAWVLQSRIFAQKGSPRAAFSALKACLTGLGITLEDEPNYEKCDRDFEILIVKIQSTDLEALVNQPMDHDSNLSAVGAVLVETISAAYWTDQLLFYQMALVMVNMHFNCGAFPQVGMAYIHLAMIAITRFNMIKFACQVAEISHTLVQRWQDPYTMGRRGVWYSLFVGHLQLNLQDLLPQVEESLEYATQAGDRIATILNFGLVGNLKFLVSENMADLEEFLCYGCEEIRNWTLDTRGGTMAIAVRQACRALQGKTSTHESLNIMNDSEHNSESYKLWLRENLENYDRQMFYYEGIEIVPLFLYGHYERAVEIGNSCLQLVDTVWSARNTRLVMLIHGLSLASSIWTKISDPLRMVGSGQDGLRSDAEYVQNEKTLCIERDDALAQLNYLKKRIEDWQAVNDVNYLVWSKLLAAQTAEMEGCHGLAMEIYEQSLDHASAHKLLFEEALANYLLAGLFLRTGSRRAAKGALDEAILLYRAFGAVGVAKYIEDEHSLLLKDLSNKGKVANAAVQTEIAGVSPPLQNEIIPSIDSDHRQKSYTVISETREERLTSTRDTTESGLQALDMLDLTSILESSQVISSVLQVDQLLKTMCEIILHNCGGLATTAAIIIEDDDLNSWNIAASADAEKGAQAHTPGILLEETALVAEGVILYCTRFRETVFVPDLISDERFSNVTETWAARNKHGKSVIAIPISHGNKPLLGVLYLEGEPNAFTKKNLTLLQLLVNQIGISYSNALTMKEVEKVSASNNAMVELQRAALAKALAAEEKANIAKAEALRNLKLAEEAVKAKSIFLANVSHELRTPLNGVIGNAELLRDSCLNKSQMEMADSIRMSADLLLAVINDILDFSKMEAKKMELYIVAFRANEIMHEIFRSVSYSSKEDKNVSITQDISLPGCLIYGDPVRLHQVLGNLVSNSMKFTENGTIVVGAKKVWETEDEVELKFWVKDTGIGIPSQQLPKLFKPFSQADASTARKYGGSGLGLSICKSLIESMMGGKISLESVEGQGTTCWFRITFPKAHQASPGDCPKSVEQKLPPCDHSEHSRESLSNLLQIPRGDIRVCIAEDNPVNKKIAVQFLHKLGFQLVDAYENGLEAIKGLRLKAKEGKPYHIIFMDVQMPVLDGYEATRLLRQDSNESIRNILVIAMTASAIQGDREKCLESGMDDYLAKPVRSNVLKKKLDHYLQQPLGSIASNCQAMTKKMSSSKGSNKDHKTHTGILRPS
ncbi:hypothetical protein K3495_g5139 [Podosphaera aphanis]|nr:hypothetical protein K3495_g5139 [Podosphaera aphanis]